MILWALLGVAPGRQALAEAIDAWYAGDPAAVQRFEDVYASQPWDDDSAWWLARARLEQGRCAEVVQLVDGREGRGIPENRVRVLEGMGRACLGEDSRPLLARSQPREAEWAMANAAAAILAFRAKDRVEAGRLLRAAGGEPSALPARVREKLPEALIAATPDPAASGTLHVRWEGRWWAMDLDDGLGVPGEPPSPVCDARLEAGGVWRGGALVSSTPPGTQDENPLCLGDQTWFLRRDAGGDHLLAQGRELHLDRPVATYDLRADGAVALALLVADKVEVWWVPPGAEQARPLLTGPLELREPRWGG